MLRIQLRESFCSALLTFLLLEWVNIFVSTIALLTHFLLGWLLPLLKTFSSVFLLIQTVKIILTLARWYCHSSSHSHLCHFRTNIQNTSVFKYVLYVLTGLICHYSYQLVHTYILLTSWFTLYQFSFIMRIRNIAWLRRRFTPFEDYVLYFLLVQSRKVVLTPTHSNCHSSPTPCVTYTIVRNMSVSNLRRIENASILLEGHFHFENRHSFHWLVHSFSFQSE